MNTAETQMRQPKRNDTSMKCYACDRKIGKTPAMADTHDDQWVYVGMECFKLIRASGETGYQPPKGGPRLWLLTPERQVHYQQRGLWERGK